MELTKLRRELQRKKFSASIIKQQMVEQEDLCAHCCVKLIDRKHDKILVDYEADHLTPWVFCFESGR